jgi:hypothetical protein
VRQIIQAEIEVGPQDVEEGSQDEDEWEKRNGESDSDSERECIDGLGDKSNPAVVPSYLKRNEKMKKLMAGARRRVPVNIRAPTTKRGKALPLKPQRFQMLPRNK